MMKFVAYYRVSTRMQFDSGLGLDAQRAYLAHFLRGEEIVAEFTETASGSTRDPRKRPLFNEALKLCKANKYVLAVAKIDRLTRVTEHALEIYSELGGRLFSCDVPSQNGVMDKFTLTLFMAIAERERELISIRTKQALEARKSAVGEWRISQLKPEHRLKAYATNRTKAQNNPNNVRAAGYAEVLRAQGLSYQSIADRLNAQGFQTPTGLPFHKNSVRQLLCVMGKFVSKNKRWNPPPSQ